MLVVGDICLDRWCRYEPALAEASRETGIPRCGVTATAVTPGAGGTVAGNLAALGVGRVSVLGAVGHDGFGHELRSALAAKGIESNLLVESETVQTFTYTKLINAETGVEDLPRVDFVNTVPLPVGVEERLLAHFRDSVSEFDAIVEEMAETLLSEPKMKDLFYDSMEIILREMPIVSIVQTALLTPNNYTYWSNWPDIGNDYQAPSQWWGNFYHSILTIEPTQ